LKRERDKKRKKKIQRRRERHKCRKREIESYIKRKRCGWREDSVIKCMNANVEVKQRKRKQKKGMKTGRKKRERKTENVGNVIERERCDTFHVRID
jgi:hypothetical protein